MVLNLEAEVAEVMEMSEKADPLPLSLGEASEPEPPRPSPAVLLLAELTLMTVFMAALLLLKSQTSITESSSPLCTKIRFVMISSSDNLLNVAIFHISCLPSKLFRDI